MHLLEHGMTVWIASVMSLFKDIIFAIVAAALVPWVQHRVRRWRSRSTVSDEGPRSSLRAPRVRGRDRSSRVRAGGQSQRIGPVRRSVSLTPEQEADLIGRGLPEMLVRSGKLDHA